MPTSPPFPTLAKARADLAAGALFCIGGSDGFLYYGQVCPNKQIGFFRFRSKGVDAAGAQACAVMSRFTVGYHSIGRALRSGHWLALGRVPIRLELELEPVLVQWPAGSTTVILWQGAHEIGMTDAWDPTVQKLQVIAAYDAIHHVPERLVADFSESPDSWKVGGSVRRHRLLAEDLAKRFPEQPWHQLPENWVSTGDA